MATLKVEVVYALAGRAEIRIVELPAGATVSDAIRASGLPVSDAFGIHGKRVGAGQRLANGDRVELYRPLVVDPKEARRRRAGRRRV